MRHLPPDLADANEPPPQNDRFRKTAVDFGWRYRAETLRRNAAHLRPHAHGRQYQQPPGRCLGKDKTFDRVTHSGRLAIQLLIGVHATVTLEIAAQLPEGAPEQVVRAVTENGRTLRFSSQGFERE
jgi:hypothetical protein